MEYNYTENKQVVSPGLIKILRFNGIILRNGDRVMLVLGTLILVFVTIETITFLSAILSLK